MSAQENEQVKREREKNQLDGHIINKREREKEREKEREREKNQLDGHIINMASPTQRERERERS